MPYFQIDGKAIVNPTDSKYAECPVEVIPASQTCGTAAFFKPTGSVDITGVTDSGYKLCTPDVTSLNLIKTAGDAFESNLQVDSVAQPYCKKGCAPTGECLYTAPYGSYTLTREVSGEFYISKGSGHKYVLSTAAQSRKIFTIAACGAGGGGGGGNQGWMGTSGGGGGAGAGASILFTFKFADNITEKLVFSLTVGKGGGGGGENGNGGTGGYTHWAMTSPLAVDILYCAGGDYGRASGTGGGGGGGSGSVAAPDYNFAGVSKYIVDYQIHLCEGGEGGKSQGNLYNEHKNAISIPNYTISPTQYRYDNLSDETCNPKNWQPTIVQGSCYCWQSGTDADAGAGGCSWFGDSCDVSYDWGAAYWGEGAQNATTAGCAVNLGVSHIESYWAKIWNPHGKFWPKGGRPGSGTDYTAVYPGWGSGGAGGGGDWDEDARSGRPGGSGMFSIFY